MEGVTKWAWGCGLHDGSVEETTWFFCLKRGGALGFILVREKQETARQNMLSWMVRGV